MLLSVSHFWGEREKKLFAGRKSFCGASRIAGFGEGTPQQVSREGQNRRIADFGTVVETCSVTAADCPSLVFSYIERTEQDLRPAADGLFSFSPKILLKGCQLPAGRGLLQIFFCFCNAEKGNLATGGAENFSFHSLHHRVLKFAKHQGRKIPPSLTTTPGEGQNGRVVKWTTKKQQIFFKTYCFHCPPVGGWYSVWNMVRGGQHSLLSAP